MIYMTLLFLLWVLGLSLLLITVVVLWCCKYLPIYNQRSIEKFMKVSLHNTIAKYINMYSIFVTLISVRAVSLIPAWFIYMLLLIGLTPTKQEKTYLKPVAHRFQETCRSTRKTVAKRWAPVVNLNVALVCLYTVYTERERVSISTI